MASKEFVGSEAELTAKILAYAYEVHARSGPELLESAYKSCLVHCLQKRGLHVETEVPIGIEFDEISIPTAYRADLIVEQKVLLELKAYSPYSLPRLNHLPLKVGFSFARKDL